MALATPISFAAAGQRISVSELRKRFAEQRIGYRRITDGDGPFGRHATAEIGGVREIPEYHAVIGRQRECSPAGVAAPCNGSLRRPRRLRHAFGCDVRRRIRYSRPACLSIARNCADVRRSIAWVTSLPSRS